MGIDRFCVNDKEIGSIWGKLIDWEEASKLAKEVNDEFYTNPNCCIRFEQVLNGWDGKKCVWLKNYKNGDNLFIEIR